MGYRTQHIDGTRFQIPEDIDRIRQLWAAVLNRTIADLRGQGLADPDDKRRFAEQRAEMRAKAREYVERTDFAVGGFEWICRLMGIDSGRARAKLLEVRKNRTKADAARDARLDRSDGGRASAALLTPEQRRRRARSAAQARWGKPGVVTA